MKTFGKMRRGIDVALTYLYHRVYSIGVSHVRPHVVGRFVPVGPRAVDRDLDDRAIEPPARQADLVDPTIYHRPALVGDVMVTALSPRASKASASVQQATAGKPYAAVTSASRSGSGYGATANTTPWPTAPPTTSTNSPPTPGRDSTASQPHHLHACLRQTGLHHALYPRNAQ